LTQQIVEHLGNIVEVFPGYPNAGGRGGRIAIPVFDSFARVVSDCWWKLPVARLSIC
jgi:hypothetical protein